MAESKIKGGSITIEKPMGGWTPQNSTKVPVEGIVDPNTGTSNQYSQSTNISLHRGNFIGHIAPGEIFTAITDAGGGSPQLNDLPIGAAATTDGGNSNFAVLQSGSIVAFNSTTTLGQYTVSVSSNHSGAGGNQTTMDSVTGNDIILFKDNLGVEYILWTWQSHTTNSPFTRGADIAYRTTKNASSVENDCWFSSVAVDPDTGSPGAVLTASASVDIPHKLVQGFNGNVYCTNGQYIASVLVVPGANNGIDNMVGNPKKLNLGAGWMATGICNYGDKLAIVGCKTTRAFVGASRELQTRVWLWDGSDLGANFHYDIPDSFSGGIFNKDGVLHIFTTGVDNKSRAKYLTPYNTWANAFEYGSGQVGYVPLQGSMDSTRGTLVFAQIGTGNGYLNTIDGSSFHQEMCPNDSVTPPTFIGFVKNLDAGGLYVGVQATGVSGSSGLSGKILQINSSSYFPNATWYSNLIQLPYKSTIRKVKVFFSQFAAASSLQVAVMRNYDSAAFGSGNDLLGATVTTSTFANITTDMSASIIKTIPDVNAFYLGLKFNHSAVTDTAAIVRKIVVEYEETPQP